MKPKLTDPLVRKLPAPARGNRITYDGDIKGFGFRVTASGARSFILNYRCRGRERRYTIGSYPDWSVAAARKTAGDLKKLVDQGIDPLSERQEDRAAATVNELAERYIDEHLPKKRPSSQRDDRAMLDQFILPRLGAEKVADIRFTDIDRLHRELTKAGKPIRANRVVALLSKMFSLAIKWEMRLDQPVKGIERNPEQRRQRYLTPAELKHLSAVLAKHRHQSADAVRLLLLTGARCGEVLGARWDQFDLDAGVWTKPSALTKQRREHRVPLSAPALDVLKAMKARHDKRRKKAVADGPYVFAGKTPKHHQLELRKFWSIVRNEVTVALLAEHEDPRLRDLVAKARKKLGRQPKLHELKPKPGIQLPAGMRDLRLHDLRHSFGSVLASAGMSLPIIGALLGHTQAQTTNRYAHLFDDPLRAATEQVGKIVGSANAFTASQ